MPAKMSFSEQADALEHRMIEELDPVIVKSRLFNLADGDTGFVTGGELMANNPGKLMLIGWSLVIRKDR